MHLRIERRSARLLALAQRLARGIAAPIEAALRRVEVAAASLAATSPFAVLERGYSITQRQGASAPLKDAAGLRSGERIRTRLASGWILSEVEKTGEAPDGAPRSGSGQ